MTTPAESVDPAAVTVGASLPLWPAASATTTAEIPRLTPYLPAGTPAGAIIVCPGGGYARLTPHEGEPVARWLAGLGLVAFVLEYRVAPHRHPVPLGDARRAIRLVRARAAEWGLASPRVAILGFSAGGHVAASAGVLHEPGNPASSDPVERQPSRPDALVLCYPVLTFGAHRHQGSVDNLLGPDAPDEARDALSLELAVGPDTPTAFLWHTADDASVLVEHSLLFAGALRRHGVPFALHVYPHGRHGLGLARDNPDVEGWTALCAHWLAAQGFGNDASPPAW